MREIAYACLKRTAEQFLEEGREPPERFLSFFAAALAFRQMRQIAPMIFHYEPARAQLELGFLPDAPKLLCSPVDSSSPTLFHLYCLYSELLLSSLDTLKRDNSRQFRMLLVMESEGRPPVESANFVLSSLLPGGMTVEGWFHTQASRLLRNIQRTLPSESIAEQVKELQTISIARLDSPDTLVTISLEDAPEAFADFRIDKDALGRLQSRYLSLVPQAPPLLQPAIGEIANAIGLLSEGKSVAFRRKLASAKYDFKEALTRQREIENELDAFAAEHTNVILSYQSLMEIVRRYERLSAEFFPDEQ